MPVELRKTASKNIRAMRNKRKQTQEQLSDKADIDYKYLQMIEGKNPPNISLKTLEKLAKGLKTTPSKLLESK